MKNSRQFARGPAFGRSNSARSTLFHGANISDAAEHNKRIILQVIRANGRIARKHIAEILGLTPPTVFNITNELAASGLIIPAARTSGERGKPTTFWMINPDGVYSLGLAVDRDHLTLVLLDFAGQVRHRYHQEIAFADPQMTREFAADCIEDLLQHAPEFLSRLVGFGVALPDDLDKTHLPGQPDSYSNWSNMTGEALIEGLIDVPIWVENDAAAAALGEMYFGGGLESDSFFYILISAGLGGGLVVNRHYHRGAHGRSGEIGFLPQVNPFRPRFNHLDKTLGDAVLLTDLFQRLHAEGHRAILPEDLLDLNPSGQACIDEWISSISDYLYLPLLNILYAIDPDAFYVGGRLPAPILARLCTEISKRLSISVGTDWPRPLVRPASLAKDASAIGAAVLAVQLYWSQARPG